MSTPRFRYLPHHAVTNPHKRDNVRVLFHCAAKYKGTSLNDNSIRGPDLMNSLIGVLMRFRKERVALLSADVEAMFHQVFVKPSCYSKLACFGFKQKPFALQDSNHYVFEQKTFCNLRKGTPISIIDKMSCLLSQYVVDKLFCLVMFSFFFLDP